MIFDNHEEEKEYWENNHVGNFIIAHSGIVMVVCVILALIALTYR